MDPARWNDDCFAQRRGLRRAFGRNYSFKVSGTRTSGPNFNTETERTVAWVLEPFSFSPASNTVVSGRIGQGITGSATVNRHPDFADPISYSTSGLPLGLAPTFVSTTQGSRETVDFTMTVPPTVSPGTYPVQIVGTSNGVVKTSSLSVLVLAALPAPDLSIRVFMPSGVTATFTQPVVSDTITSVRFTVNAVPQPGPYTVVVTGAGQGGLPATVNLQLPAFEQPSFTIPQGTHIQDFNILVARTPALVGVPLTFSIGVVPPQAVAGLVVSAGTNDAGVVSLRLDGTTPPGSHLFTVNITDGTSVWIATTTIIITAPMEPVALRLPMVENHKD